MLDPDELMRTAIRAARRGMAAGQAPFGCAIALDDRVLADTHNTVKASTDPTAHAEVNALRIACLQLGTTKLEGAIVATTCEPCPMCAAAMHWAHVEHIYFGASITDANTTGFTQLRVTAAELLQQGESSVEVTENFLGDECRALVRDWQAR